MKFNTYTIDDKNLQKYILKDILLSYKQFKIQTTQRRHEHDVIATIRNNTNNLKYKNTNNIIYRYIKR